MGEQRERILRKVHLVLTNVCRDDGCRWRFGFSHALALTCVLQKLRDRVKELPAWYRRLFNALPAYFYPATQQSLLSDTRSSYPATQQSLLSDTRSSYSATQQSLLSDTILCS